MRRRRHGNLFIVKRARIPLFIEDLLLLFTHIRSLHNLARYVRNWMTMITYLFPTVWTTTWNFEAVNALDNFE